MSLVALVCIVGDPGTLVCIVGDTGNLERTISSRTTALRAPRGEGVQEVAKQMNDDFF